MGLHSRKAALAAAVKSRLNVFNIQSNALGAVLKLFLRIAFVLQNEFLL